MFVLGCGVLGCILVHSLCVSRCLALPGFALLGFAWSCFVLLDSGSLWLVLFGIVWCARECLLDVAFRSLTMLRLAMLCIILVTARCFAQLSVGLVAELGMHARGMGLHAY